MKIKLTLIAAGLLSLRALIKQMRNSTAKKPGMVLNSLEYLEYGSVNVMLAHDFYPEGHQGGVGIIQNGQRTATNGDLKLEPTPGQWSPIPKVGKRVVNKATHEISVRMEYPNPEINRKGFNPIIYPDLNFAYNIRVLPVGNALKLSSTLINPAPMPG
jgi:endoglucanase